MLVSPGLASNLLSVGQLVDNNCNVNFSRDGCLVQEQVSRKVIVKGPKVGRFFPLQFISSHLSFACNNVLNSYEDWHRKLGHPNSTVLTHLFKTGLLGNKQVICTASVSCLVCKLSKSKTLPFLSGAHRASNCFEMIQRSCPNTPQQKGLAEQKNRHLLDVTRSLLLQASVPPRFWVEALSTIVFLINRLPSIVIDFDSPFFRLFKVQPDYSDLHTFGCVCFVHLPSFERHKLGPQSVPCAFMEYNNSHKGFVCYDVSNRRFEFRRMLHFLIINSCFILFLLT